MRINSQPIPVPFARRRRGAFLLALALALAAAGPATAQSAAELLEQGIYTEETVGDLDAAIEIYTQVVEDAEANRPHVAQARFRLALCHWKRGDAAEARAALDELIRELPEQERLVAQAREQLAAMKPGLALEAVPWQDGELLEYRIVLPTGKDIGVLYLRAESTTVDGVPAWRLEQRKVVFVAADNHGVSRVLVDRDSQRPIQSTFQHGIIGRADTTYGPDGIEIVGATTTRLDSDRGIYDNEQSMHLLRMLPLEVGYEAGISFLAPWATKVEHVDLAVTGTGACEVPAGDFTCYELALDVAGNRQTFWVSTGPERYPVKVKTEGVVLELAEIGRTLPGEPVTYGVEEFGFSGTLPAGWLPYVHRTPARPNKVAIRLLDPDFAASSSLEVDRCAPDRCPTLEETAERELSGARERFEGYELRQASWTERTIAGRPAISFAGDYQLGGEPWVQYRLYTFSDDTRFELIFRTPADRFEELRPTFDRIAESLETE